MSDSPSPDPPDTAQPSGSSATVPAQVARSEMKGSPSDQFGRGNEFEGHGGGSPFSGFLTFHGAFRYFVKVANARYDEGSSMKNVDALATASPKFYRNAIRFDAFVIIVCTLLMIAVAGVATWKTLFK